MLTDYIEECEKCGKPGSVSYPSDEPKPDVCDLCITIGDNTEKAQYLMALKNLPLEERIAKIEEWIYDGNRHCDPLKLNL